MRQTEEMINADRVWVKEAGGKNLISKKKVSLLTTAGEIVCFRTLAVQHLTHALPPIL